MIERQTIDGRSALVHYLSKDMKPRGKDDYELLRVLFDDGQTMYLLPQDDDDREGAGADQAFDAAVDRFFDSAFDTEHGQWIGDALSFDGDYRNWIGDAAQWKEEQHPRKKSGQFTRKGQGEAGETELADTPDVPAPPTFKGEHRSALAVRKHLNAIYEHAKAGEWDKVEAYPVPKGVNTQARVIQRYHAALMKFHAEQETREPEPLPIKEPPPEPEKPPPKPEPKVEPPKFSPAREQVDKLMSARGLVQIPAGVGGAIFQGTSDKGKRVYVHVTHPDVRDSTWIITSPGVPPETGEGLSRLEQRLTAVGLVEKGTARPEGPTPEVKARTEAWHNALGAHGFNFKFTSGLYGAVFEGRSKISPRDRYKPRVTVRDPADPDSSWEITGKGMPVQGTGLADLRRHLADEGFPAKTTPEAWGKQQSARKAKNTQSWLDVGSNYGMTKAEKQEPMRDMSDALTISGKTTSGKDVTVIIGDPGKDDSSWWIRSGEKRGFGRGQKNLHEQLFKLGMSTSGKTGGPAAGSVKAWTPPAPKPEAEVKAMNHKEYADYFTDQMKGSGIRGPLPGDRLTIRPEHRAAVLQTAKDLATSFPLPRPIIFNSNSRVNAYAVARGSTVLSISDYWYNTRTPEELLKQHALDNRIDEKTKVGFHDAMDDPMSTVIHEYGHLIDHQMGFELKQRIGYWSATQRTISGFRGGENTDKVVSRYALKDNQEWFAEAFAAMKYGDDRAKNAPGVEWLKGQIEEFIKVYRDAPERTASGRERWQQT